jgi:group II intron reverse transcriptase/maturase
MELIANRINISNAYLRVRRNHGSHGIDGRSIDETIDDMKRRREEILETLLQGKYKATPVRGVEIPKPNGGIRQLGIPTVQDRIIQQAVHQILSPLFEPQFSDSSYGFRPGRSAHDAVEKMRNLYNQGYCYVVDIDLSKYFDTINHDLLLEMLRRTIKDERVIQLIKSFFKSGMMKDGVVVETEAGSPQGGIFP